MQRIPDYPSADSDRWSKVDSFFSNLLAPADQFLDAALSRNADAGMPAHDVSATQGQMLTIFAKMARASRILEIGTLGGYSTIWMARTLPSDGKLITIEADIARADVARTNIERAGLADVVELCVGAALDVLPTLKGPFDLIFIDADKPNNPQYLQWALRLSRPGTVIVGDNVVRGGAVVDATSSDPNVQGVRQFLTDMSEEPRLTSTAIQTVGEKGWDGFTLTVVA